MSYSLPSLRYSYDALEPQIDSKTMNLHHSRHHAAYVRNLNQALSDAGVTVDVSLTEFMSEMDRFKIPEAAMEVVKFNAGGHYNHSFFWDIISPSVKEVLSNDLGGAIIKSFGSLEDFKAAFTKVATSHLGSGWVWLCVDNLKREAEHLFLCSTLNHDNPIMAGHAGRRGIPILTLDLWEHAYYLKYNDSKLGFISNFWKVVDWNRVAERYEFASSPKHG